MKRTILLVATFLICYSLKAQDGSDIEYVKKENLTEKYLGRFAHLDFYNRSFHSALVDTVEFKVKGNLVSFVERRFDNGFNNWFSQQYLEFIDKIDGLKLRVEKCKISQISLDFIGVTNFYAFYTVEGKLLPDKSFTERVIFPKEIIQEILIYNK